MKIDPEEAKRVWDRVAKLREEGKLPPLPTEEELKDEPTALANSKYREEAEAKNLVRIYDDKKAIYSQVEEMIIRWNIDGTRTAGSLTREILKIIEFIMKYPPITPVNPQETKHVGAIGRRLEEERRRQEEMKVELELDPEIEWIIKKVDGKNYISVKQN